MTQMTTLFLGQRVWRDELPNFGAATVITIEEEAVEIAYDEGGTGWWTSDCLLFSNPTEP